MNRQNSQKVCPWNSPKFVQITGEEAFQPHAGVHGAELIELMGMDQAEFSRRFKGSPVKRAKRRGLLRNVAVALGNWGAAEVRYSPPPPIETKLEFRGFGRRERLALAAGSGWRSGSPAVAVAANAAAAAPRSARSTRGADPPPS